MLGYRALAEYIARPQFFGSTIGRYANRIRSGRFRLDGQDYQIPATDGDHALHGGIAGFDKRLWDHHVAVGRARSRCASSVAMARRGFPGTLETELTYALAEDNALTIAFTARTRPPDRGQSDQP